MGYLKSRVVLREGKLISIISDGEVKESGAADLSPSIRIDALQFQQANSYQSGAAILYQKSWDSDNKYQEVNLIVYQDYNIGRRIPYFSQQDLPLDPTKYPSTIPTIEWANYKLKNSQFGYFWFQV